MPEYDLEKLLGGFAADTLTADEKQQLYRAALHDQELFAALADEQALKELLTDPVVRQKLLRTLQKAPSASHSTTSWLDWVRRPAGLAWAGGLTAAVFAVILGTRIYQDSVKEAGRSVATEEAIPSAPPTSVPSATQPAAPPIIEPQMNVQDNAKQAAPLSPPSNTAKRRTTTIAKPEEQRARDSSSPLRQHEEDALQGPPESIPSKLARSKEEASTPIDKNLAGTPPTSASVPAPTTIPAPSVTPGQASSTLSARSLFYGKTGEFDAGLIPEEQKRSHSSLKFGRGEKNRGQFATAKTENVATAPKPLGIRYSLVASETERRYRARDADAINQTRSLNLIIEVNQDGYLQVWRESESVQPHLLFPIREEETLSSKLIAYKHRTIPVSPMYGNIILQFSRVPFNSSPNQDTPSFNRSAAGQLHESTTADDASDSQEQITYVVNQDSSLSDIVVRIPLPQP